MYCYLKLDPAEMWFFQSFWAEVTTLLSCVLQNDENNNPALEETGEGGDLMESRLKKPHLEKVRRTSVPSWISDWFNVLQNLSELNKWKNWTDVICSHKVWVSVMWLLRTASWVCSYRFEVWAPVSLSMSTWTVSAKNPKKRGLFCQVPMPGN